MRYIQLPDETHLSLPMRMDWLADPIVAWLDDAAAGRCNALSLPPDPARQAEDGVRSAR